MTRSEGELCRDLQALIAETAALFRRLIQAQLEPLGDLLARELAATPAAARRRTLQDVLTRCRNEIVACFSPPNFSAWLRQNASAWCAALRRGQAVGPVQPAVLPPLRLTPAVEPEPPEALPRFKSQVGAIKSQFWSLIERPHLRSDGSAADKRTLLVQYARKRGMAPWAEDIADETLLKALLRLYQFEPQPGKHLMNWLYTIAWSTLVDFCRRQEREQRLDRPPAETSAEEHPHQKALEEVAAVLVLSCLIEVMAREPDGLPKGMICFFHQVLGHKPKEIAEELGRFTLGELLGEFRRACLRMDAFDHDEGPVQELLAPLERRLERPRTPDEKEVWGREPLSRCWERQKRSDYYIQNVSRRLWQKVVKRVRFRTSWEVDRKSTLGR